MNLAGKIKIAEITDVGMVRDHNEDAIGSNAEIGLLVLADGMGGTTPARSQAASLCRP